MCSGFDKFDSGVQTSVDERMLSNVTMVISGKCATAVFALRHYCFEIHTLHNQVHSVHSVDESLLGTIHIETLFVYCTKLRQFLELLIL